MREEPKRPDPNEKFVVEEICMYDDDPIIETIKRFQEEGFCINDLTIKLRDEYGDTNIVMVGKRKMTDEEYNRALKIYEKELVVYNEWFERNKRELETLAEYKREYEKIQKSQQELKLKMNKIKVDPF